MTKRRIYIGLLVLAIIAFAVDRLFLGEPEATQAKGVAVRPKHAPAPAVQTPVDGPTTEDLSLAWLDRLPAAGPSRDVFTSTPAWLSGEMEEEEGPEGTTAVKAGKINSARAFKAAHQLQAITVMGDGGLAVVDGKCMHVGDSLDDFRLAHVKPDEAEFQRGRERVVLTLPQTGH